MNTTERPRILVAEDNRVLSEVIRFNLEKAGYEVVVAGTGTEAMRRLQQETFHLLVTDYQMPEANGEELVAYLRSQLKLTNLPVIMCSAKGMELDATGLYERLRVSKVIYKPFSMREIVAHTRQLLEASAPTAEPVLA